MERSSRRKFLRDIRLTANVARFTPAPLPDPNEFQGDREEKGASGNSAGALQFSLMTLLVIITIVSVFLAINKMWPKESVTIAIVAAALCERIYRKRIKATIGEKNYEIARLLLDRLAAILGGAMLGGFVGLLLSIAIGTLASVLIGAVTGAVVGMVFPRAVLAICSLLP